MATYSETGITFDEPGHMACGLQFLAQHVYRYETQHPPLARMASALGPFLDGARPMGNANQDFEGAAILYRNTHVLRTLILMRLGVLPFFGLAGLIVYFWTRRYIDTLTAVIATGLFTLLPPVLAHAGVATTDMALTACLGAAFYALIRWAETPDIRRSVILGVATGLMVLTKFTALAFLPATALLALASYVSVQRPSFHHLLTLIKRRAASFVLAVATGALVIWAGYLFSFGPVPGWHISLPAPEVFDGVRSALHHNSIGHPAYLFGRVSISGWWYYFPVVLAVKTPLAFLLLVAIGAWICWTRRRQTAYWIPWALSLGILAPAMIGRVNIGVRHILPVYIGFSIVAAIALAELALQRRARRWMAGMAAALLLWLIVSGAAQHPNYLAYFNELAGGHPETILADSDLDWGQDTVRLAEWARGQGLQSVSFTAMNIPASWLSVWPGIPNDLPVDPRQPREGWTAISPSLLLFNQYGLNHRNPNVKPWFEYLRPAEKIGAFLLYYIPPGSVSRNPS